MFEFLLLIMQLHGESRSPVGRHYTPSIVKVAEPSWSHATERETVISDDGIWVAPEPTIAKDGIPPSPATLNAKGWKSVAGLLGFTAGSPVEPDPRFDPKNDPTDLSPVTPDIAELLVGWEKESSGKDGVGYQFDRTVYDLARNVEIRSSGTLVYQSADQDRFDIRDASTPKARSDRQDTNGRNFTVEKGVSESWTWGPGELEYRNHTDRTYSVMPLASELNKKSSGLFREALKGRAPFIIDIDKDAIRREWSLAVVKRDDSTIILEAIPRTAARKQQFHKCLIRIDPKIHRVSAIKYVDASERFETVYVFKRQAKLPALTSRGCTIGPAPFENYRLVSMKMR